jgi:hypothetical protein
MKLLRIFTFGADHVSPYTGERLGNQYVTITVPNDDGKALILDRARSLMLAAFGQQWSNEYATEESAGVERFGLIEHARIEVTLTPDHDPDVAPSVTPPRQAQEKPQTCHAKIGEPYRMTECGMPIEYVTRTFLTPNEGQASGWKHVDRSITASHHAVPNPR